MISFEEQVRKYMWPHLDFGKYQFPCNQKNLRHGDIVEWTYLENGVKKIKKATFRLIEVGLYQDDWVAKALPLAKEIWNNESDNQP